MTENEFLLFDRLEVIKQTINKYGEDNFYISFSGGKDSTVLHYLIDMALPDNKIPRVFSNTGIEYTSIVKFVKEMAKSDERIKIIQNKKSIKGTLEKEGYPFKSKLYSHHYEIYRNNKDEIQKYIRKIEDEPSLKEDYDFIHNLPKGVKTIVKYIYNLREREREIGQSIGFLTSPNCLRYQWELDLNISDKCCLEFKEKPIIEWEKENNRFYKILGLMKAEGGRRVTTKCQTFKNGKLSFSPLAVVSKEWEEWFIKEHNIQLCELYYPPYNFDRTGCKGCPFNINIQRELYTMEKLLPNERKQCEIIWKPIYEEYRRIGYRLKKNEEIKLF